jgi:hypothetical protein
MSDYTIYRSKDGLWGKGVHADCASDGAAQAHARRMVAGSADEAEVWIGTKMIGKVSADQHPPAS